MKKKLTKFIAFGGAALLMLWACKKDGTLVTSNGGKAGTLTASTMTPVLDKSKLNDASAVVSFSFTMANYGFSAAVTNTLQIDAAGDNWAKPMSVTLAGNVTSQSYSTVDFNNLLLKLNVPAGKASQVNVRIQHSISASITPVYSNVLSLTVTPFNLTSWVYVVGQFDGWPPLPAAGTDSLISATGNGIYTGIMNFPAGDNQFLILPQSFNYDNKWATTTGTNVTSSTVTVNGPNNLTAPTTPGNYIVTLNTNNNTISFTPADYYSIIGSSTPGANWTTDLWLKFVNDGNNNWVGTFPVLAGEYKFRLDGQWAISWGPGAAAGSAVSSGAIGDGNMQLSPAGTYTFTFNNPPTALGGSASPLGTTTFTTVKQ